MIRLEIICPHHPLEVLASFAAVMAEPGVVLGVEWEPMATYTEELVGIEPPNGSANQFGFVRMPKLAPHFRYKFKCPRATCNYSGILNDVVLTVQECMKKMARLGVTSVAVDIEDLLRRSGRA